jgi:hypothetical protein
MRKLLSALFCVFFALTIYAQAPVAASIDGNFKIILPADQPLSDTYIIDISAIPFTDANDCTVFFDKMHEIVVNYEVLYDAKQVRILLSYDNRNAGWDLAQWNAYFAKRAKKMAALFAASH